MYQKKVVGIVLVMLITYLEVRGKLFKMELILKTEQLIVKHILTNLIFKVKLGN